MRQRPCSFLLWPVGVMIPRARRIRAAADAQGEPAEPRQCHDRSPVVIGDPEPSSTLRAARLQRLQELLPTGGWPRVFPFGHALLPIPPVPLSQAASILLSSRVYHPRKKAAAFF